MESPHEESVDQNLSQLNLILNPSINSNDKLPDIHAGKRTFLSGQLQGKTSRENSQTNFTPRVDDDQEPTQILNKSER